MIHDVNAAPSAETAGEDTARQHRVYLMATEKGEVGTSASEIYERGPPETDHQIGMMR